MQPTVCLSLHTTDTPGALALCSGSRVDSRPLDASGKHASTLLGSIDRLLVDAHIDMSEVQKIVLTRGPGSFTGIRIGMATAQGLAQAIGVDVCFCDSLWAEAAAHATTGWMAVALDARRGEVYAGLYRMGPDGPRQILAPFVEAPAAAARCLLDAVGAEEPLCLTGSGAALLPFETDVSSRIERLPSVARSDVARASAMAALSGALPCCAPRELEPLYLRKSDAELNREARLGTR